MVKFEGKPKILTNYIDRFATLKRKHKLSLVHTDDVLNIKLIIK